jgi:beta-phosphoglucomutase family hydrolase
MQTAPSPHRSPRNADVTIYRALLFDLDGVITRTATLHAAAWKRLFDGFLTPRDRAPFDIATDYPRHVDGRPRYDAVRSVLESRGIVLPWGSPADPPGEATVCALGNAKNRLFAEELHRHGVEVFDDTVALIRAARRRGRRMAVVSASENCIDVLRQAGLLELFDATVTGVDVARLGLRGKPAPDTFLLAAELLRVPPSDAVVFEDALSGVRAGRAGGFGLIVGVDRGAAAEGLLRNGADITCSDLRRLWPGA